MLNVDLINSASSLISLAVFCHPPSPSYFDVDIAGHIPLSVFAVVLCYQLCQPCSAFGLAVLDHREHDVILEGTCSSSNVTGKSRRQ